MMIHYKLPLDEELDADIVSWINKFPRTHKGEMVRHAIRYYMSVLEEGETIKFPNVSNNSEKKRPVVSVDHENQPTEMSQAERNKKERKRPVLNPNGLK